MKKTQKESFDFKSAWKDVEKDDKMLEKVMYLFSGFGNVPDFRLSPTKHYLNIDFDDDQCSSRVMTLVNIASAKVHTDLNQCLGCLVKAMLMALYNEGGQQWIEKSVYINARNILESIEVHSVDGYNKLQKSKLLLYLLDHRCSIWQYKPVAKTE